MTKLCALCYQPFPVAEFVPVGGGRLNRDCKACRAVPLGNTCRDYQRAGYHNQDVARVILDETITEYEKKLRLIKTFEFDMDDVNDTAEINKMLEIMAVT